MSTPLLLSILFGGMIFIQLFWIATDPRPFRKIIKSYIKPKGLVWLAWRAITTILVIITTLFFPLPPTRWDALITAVGLMLYFVGLVLAVWAKLILKECWGPAGEDIDSNRHRHLVTTGPYAFSRNPIYIAVFLFTIGLFIALRSYLIFLVLFPTVNFYKAAIKEEFMLERHYGQQYRDYKARVPKFL